MSWTTPSAHIFATSEVVTASTMNTYIQANLTFLGVGFGAQMQQATAQSIPNATETLVHFDTIVNDPNGMCTTGAGALITIPANAGGVYVITWRCGINAVSVTVGTSWLRHNGTDAHEAVAVGSASAQVLPQGSVCMLLAAADTLQVTVQHNAGAAENTWITTAPVQPYLSCHLISPN